MFTFKYNLFQKLVCVGEGLTKELAYIIDFTVKIYHIKHNKNKHKT